MVRSGVAGAEVDEIAVYNACAARRVVRPHLLLGEQIVVPDDIGIGGPELEGRAWHEFSQRAGAADRKRMLAGLGQIKILAHIRPGVAVVEAVGIEAEDLAMAGDGVYMVSVD